MKRLLIAILISVCTYVSAQKPVFNTYFDTAYWFSDEADTSELITEPLFILDTMAGNNYGKYSQFALQYAQAIFNTKVGDGGCGEVGDEMCRKAHAEMIYKGRMTGINVSILEIGDIIIIPQFIDFYNNRGHKVSSTRAEHLVMFMGMKDDSTMLIINQNGDSRSTYMTTVIIEELYLPGMKFFNGNNKHVPYMDVYGYEPRKILKKEYVFMDGN